MNAWIKAVQGMALGTPMLLMLLGTHFYFTIRLRFIQKKIPQGIYMSFSKNGQGEGNISPFSALATSLAATIGTGNIIGISTAIAIGGPGAVFWCWVTGIFGIATCYAECYLSVKFRVCQADGTYAGGPMYIMEGVLKQKSAAIVFAVAAVLVSFGMGSSVQAHSIVSAVTEQVRLSSGYVGVCLAFFAGIVILGGAEQITKVCTCLVPFMSVFFLGGCFFLIWENREVFPETIQAIVKSAFSSKPVIGGITGTAVMEGLRVGISRGLFTSEAGLGSIPISAAAARTQSPYRQGLVSMTGVFWDTVVMCAVTGIAIVGCMLKEPELYQQAEANRLCFLAFSNLPVLGSEMLSVSLVLFAFATIIGWSYYGECAVRYLGKGRGRIVYKVLYICFILFGAVMPLNMVWGIADLFNLLMMIPNLICLWMLRKWIVGKEEKSP